MKCSVLVILTCLCLLVGIIPAAATLTNYSDWASFNAAYPGLPVENFQEGNLGGAFPEPLNSTSNNGYFSPGDILPGISFSTSDALGLSLMTSYQSFSFSSKTLTTAADRVDGTALVVDFSGSGVNAVGFDFYVFTNVLNSAPTDISVYDFGGNITTMTITSSNTGAAFFGVSSDLNNIKRISILGKVPGYYEWEGIDNVAFSTPVSEPATMLLLGAGLFGLAGYSRKQFRKK